MRDGDRRRLAGLALITVTLAACRPSSAGAPEATDTPAPQATPVPCDIEVVEVVDDTEARMRGDIEIQVGPGTTASGLHKARVPQPRRSLLTRRGTAATPLQRRTGPSAPSPSERRRILGSRGPTAERRTGGVR